MSLPSDLDAALTIAAGARTLLVASDFDGVLAAFDSDPMNVRPTSGTIDSLRALAAIDGVRVALVSGRDLATLRLLSGVNDDEPIVLIGSHGAETSSEQPAQAIEGAGVSPDDESVLAAVRAEVTTLVETRHPGATVEVKSRAVVVHVRGLDPDRAAAALHAARAVADAHPEVRVLAGKSVLELTVSHADKGTAVAALGEAVEANLRVYLGDDVTDEDAFRTLDRDDDVTVKVGSGETAARYRLDDEPAVAELLIRLSALCSAARSAN